MIDINKTTIGGDEYSVFSLPFDIVNEYSLSRELMPAAAHYEAALGKQVTILV